MHEPLFDAGAALFCEAIIHYPMQWRSQGVAHRARAPPPEISFAIAYRAQNDARPCLPARPPLQIKEVPPPREKFLSTFLIQWVKSSGTFGFNVVSLSNLYLISLVLDCNHKR